MFVANLMFVPNFMFVPNLILVDTPFFFVWASNFSIICLTDTHPGIDTFGFPFKIFWLYIYVCARLFATTYSVQTTVIIFLFGVYNTCVPNSNNLLCTHTHTHTHR
eukprot:GHVR01001734.1.p2 GENE.GHVR01001734.1~~GHVR01001734.1.p2  ORF type:complete len:106 (-),score=25.42 GHVR01001734.1:101-418(-)